MKTKKNEKRLTFNKQTIAAVDSTELSNVRGGYSSWVINCLDPGLIFLTSAHGC
jgi:hypothetical protein